MTGSIPQQEGGEKMFLPSTVKQQPELCRALMRRGQSKLFQALDENAAKTFGQMEHNPKLRQFYQRYLVPKNNAKDNKQQRLLSMLMSVKPHDILAGAMEKVKNI